MARRLLLNSRMGLLADDTEVSPQLTPEQFAGPGTARVGYSEYNQRELLNRWADYLAAPVATTSTVEVGQDGGTCDAQTDNTMGTPA
jgi:hypothetical protein